MLERLFDISFLVSSLGLSFSVCNENDIRPFSALFFRGFESAGKNLTQVAELEIYFSICDFKKIWNFYLCFYESFGYFWNLRKELNFMTFERERVCIDQG